MSEKLAHLILATLRLCVNELIIHMADYDHYTSEDKMEQINKTIALLERELGIEQE